MKNRERRASGRGILLSVGRGVLAAAVLCCAHAVPVVWGGDGCLELGSKGAAHSGREVLKIAPDPQGRFVAYLSDGEGVVRFWDPRTDRALGSVAHPGATALAVSPRGDLVVTAGRDGVRFWDPETRRQIRFVRHPAKVVDEIHDAVFSPRGGMVWIGGYADPSLIGIRVTDGVVTMTNADHKGWVKRIAVSPDSTRVAVVGRGAGVTLVDARTASTIGSYSTANPGEDSSYASLDLVTFAGGGKMLWTAGLLGGISGVDAASGKVVRHLEASRLKGMALSSDGQTLATSEESGTITLRDAATGAPTATLKSDERAAFVLAFSSDGRTLFTGGEVPTLRQWDVGGKQPVRAAAGHTSPISWVGFTPDEKEVWSLSGVSSTDRDRTLRRWRLKDGASLGVLDLDGIPSAADPKARLAAAYSWGELKLHDLGRGGEPRKLWGGKGSLWCLAVLSKGRRVAACEGSMADGVVHILDASSGRELLKIGGDITAFGGLAVADEGDLLAVNEGYSVKVWTLSSGVSKHTLEIAHPNVERVLHEPFSSIALHPRGAFLATGGTQAVQLWDPQAGKVIRTFAEPQAAGLAFDAQGTHLAVGAADAVSIWEVASGRRVASVAVPRGGSRALAFSASGRWLAAGGPDSVVRVCPLGRERLK